jgi:hypothetical protein
MDQHRQTAPTITLVSRLRNQCLGWNTTDVVVTWSCADGLSKPSLDRERRPHR